MWAWQGVGNCEVMGRERDRNDYQVRWIMGNRAGQNNKSQQRIAFPVQQVDKAVIIVTDSARENPNRAWNQAYTPA